MLNFHKKVYQYTIIAVRFQLQLSLHFQLKAIKFE